MEYGFYQASKQEVPLLRSLGSWMNLPLLVYAYFLRGKESFHRRRFWHQGIFEHGS